MHWMPKQSSGTAATAASLALVLAAESTAQAPDAVARLDQDAARLSSPISVAPDDVQWAQAPDSLPPGAQIAVLQGDLTKAEQHVFRLKLPDGYVVPPHSHPMREYITVLEGTLMMGMGEELDREATEPLPAGSLFILPVGDSHFVWSDGETIVQLHGVGPWGIDYVNPQDDPRN